MARKRNENGTPADFTRELELLRERIAANRTERRRVERARVPLDEAADRIRPWVESKAARHHPPTFTSAQMYETPKLLPDDLESFIAFHFREAIVEHLVEAARRELEEHGGDAIDAATRAARLDELDAEGAALEREEEDGIREAESRGVDLDRRPDALPALVLSFDPEKRTYDLPRLRALEARQRRFHAEARAIEEERELLRSKLRDAQWRVREVEDDLAPHAPPADAEKLRREAREGLERAEAQKARLAAEYTAAARRSQRVGALVQSCRDFLRAQGIEKREGATLTHTRASAGVAT